MIKSCVVLNGQVINIGEWDYQPEQVETKPAVVDEETQEIIEPAEYETIIRNHFPDGAMIEERDFEYSDDRGWYEVGTPIPKTDAERIAELEAENLTNMLALVELHVLILLMGGGSE